MKREEFLRKISEADEKLASDGIPIFARAFRALHLICHDYDGPLMGFNINPLDYPEYTGPNLFYRINEWYKKRYGEKFLMPSDRGKVPLILRNELFLIRIPMVYGRPEISILQLVEGLTDDMKVSLSKSELETIKRSFVEGYSLVYEIEDLLTIADHKPILSDKERKLLDSAVEDRNTAVKCMSAVQDTNGACFHSQQHAEKMLKVYLMSKKLSSEKELRSRKYGHNLENIFTLCLQSKGIFSELTTDIGLLKNITMDIRYTADKVSPNIASEAFWAALRIGGLSACKTSESKRRKRA